MVTSMLRNAIRSLGGARAPRGSIALQHLGLSDRDLGELRPVLAEVSKTLSVDLELHGHTGDIVLLDVPFAARLSPQLVQAFTEGRPVVLLSGSKEETDPLLSAAQRLEQRQQALLRQLREISLVRARSGAPDSQTWATPSDLSSNRSSSNSTSHRSSLGFDGEFDSRIDGEQLLSTELENGQRQALQHVMRAVALKESGTYAVSYGPDANMQFDFNARLVFVDAMAQQHLRVKRNLPEPAPGAQPHADALVCELDDTLWHLGIAAGPFPLLDEPANWWRTPLRWTGAAAMEAYSRLPRHLHLARCLVAGPATPSELRRQGQVSVSDLRRFLQATLMLGLVAWAPATPAQPADTSGAFA